MTTHMAREIAEIPEAVARQLAGPLHDYLECGRGLAALAPPALITCARGTSDQAATYFKYLMETRAGLPVASIGPSVASVYASRFQAKGFAAITISQSGGSPDLTQLQDMLRAGGARTVALLNTPDSPVGRGADQVLPLLAGPERAVAATKSLVTSLVALAAMVAGFTQDKALAGALERLPEALNASLRAVPDAFPLSIVRAGSLFVLSRGPGMAAAGEAALKLKETCRIHAEAYSAAEVLHGPVVLSKKGFSAIAFIPEDEGAASVRTALTRVAADGGATLSFGSQDADIVLPEAAHPALAPILQITAFYALVERLAVAMGEDPDNPPGLKKVTETV